QEQLLEEGSRTLVLAYTNRAVDEVCGKLVEQGIPFLRMGNELSCAPAYKEYLWDEQASRCKKMDEVRTLMRDCRVMVGTTTALTSHLPPDLSFDLAIIDEASQILEPHLLALLCARCGDVPAIRKVVMIGDHKQLPAVVKQRPEDARVDDAALQAIGLPSCDRSLFERLLRRYGDDPAVTFMLTHQGRMHPLIAQFPNECFYEGRLRAVPLPHQTSQLPPAGDTTLSSLIASRRTIFLPVKADDDRQVPDKVNTAEADLIAELVRLIYEQEKAQFDPADTLGIIVPYRAQIAALRSRIGRLGIPSLMDITIDTVERFQGSQRRYIIYGFTVRRPYQLRFLTGQCFEEDGRVIDRRLNVMMTRAREHLIMVGNPDLLRANALFLQLMQRYDAGERVED
ncbi:MAG: DNA helicase, partial [Bacteroidaceae bacterium]|nr:DNA helicase [Bacteroidaceae bacterium]